MIDYAWIPKLLHDAAFIHWWRPRELSCWLKKYVTYFGEFGYLNSSCIRNSIILRQSKAKLWGKAQWQMFLLFWTSMASLCARSIRPKLPVWISEIFLCRMERYFLPGRTDLVLSIPAWTHFPPRIITVLLEKMLKDRDEVAQGLGRTWDKTWTSLFW